ncbi:MAG: hypothetical protein ACM3ZF_11985 [Mycobacterium leprae]
MATRRRPRNADPSEAEIGHYEILRQFISAAINADKTYLLTEDMSEIHNGIEIWERISATGLLASVPPQSLVETHTTVAMLYARRYEVEGNQKDLDAAFAHQRRARANVVPGSDTDVILRMSSANWLMLRYIKGRDRADLDAAIAAYDDVATTSTVDSVDECLASGNLGRALLMRHRITGDAADRHRAMEALSHAAVKLPPDHVALPWFQRMYAEAQWM